MKREFASGNSENGGICRAFALRAIHDDSRLGCGFALVKFLAIVVVVLSFVSTPQTDSAQVATTTSGATATTVLDQMANSFSGGTAVHRIELTGTATFHAGSLQDSGNVTLIAAADGTSELQLTLTSTGAKSETQTAATASRTCQWSGSDGVAHDASTSNCLTGLVWFLPQITLQPAAPLPVLEASYGGVQSTPWGLCHVLTNQVTLGSSVASSKAATQIQKQSATTLYLDSSTALPKAMRFQLLSDSATQQIAVEVHYSNYRTFSGVAVPGHIERYLNGSLELAIDITQASILN